MTLATWPASFGFTWPGLLVAWFITGWLMAGAYAWGGTKLNVANMLMFLFAWWLLVLVILLGFLIASAQWVFDRERGPIAAFVDLVKQTFRAPFDAR